MVDKIALHFREMVQCRAMKVLMEKSVEYDHMMKRFC